MHVLLDVLRQYFHGFPSHDAPVPPARFPHLLSPVPFVNAAARTAEADGFEVWAS